MRKKKKEKVEIEVPSKAIRIQHAQCPNGHDLMDPEHKINGYASITVLTKYKDQEGLFHLDPVYGSYKNVPEINIPQGEIVQFYCPQCHVSLSEAGQTCDKCSAPMFALSLPHGGIVEACLRNGCQFHNLKLTDGEELIKRLEDEGTLDAFV